VESSFLQAQFLTQENGKLLLRLSDGSEVMVRAHTRLQVQQPSLTDPSYFQLLLGRIRALIYKRTGGTVPFELGTPVPLLQFAGPSSTWKSIRATSRK